MSRLRRPVKPLVVLVAMVAAALVLSACAFIKPGSLSLSQPGGIGSARVHFAICTISELDEQATCGPASENGEIQYLLGIAVPPGSAAPQTVTAVPVGGGSPLVFTRNEEVTTELTAASANLDKLAKEEGEEFEFTQAWPPAGLQGVGYLSAPYREQEGVAVEWSVDADFGLPVPADGGAFGGPFATGLGFGMRAVDPEQSASRPVHCFRFDSPPQDNEAICFGTTQRTQIGTSDLKVGAPAKASAFQGGQAKISYPLNFATTATPSPVFSLSASSTLPKAKRQVSSPTYTPGPLDPATHRAAATAPTVTVTVPKNAKPGTYDVTLTATAPQGGTVSAVAKLKVTKPTLKLGGVKLNKANGTATVAVKVPGAGTLTVSGNGIVKAKKKAKKAKKLKITIKAKGKAKSQLEETGTTKVKAKISFKPTSGITVKKTKSIALASTGR
ncbi:MAG TPA: hypothetical protein VFN92_03375 [Solirubrobacterales bacterium]|nr:hypothetical protein [Solirubrobacterales bacterium]